MKFSLFLRQTRQNLRIRRKEKEDGEGGKKLYLVGWFVVLLKYELDGHSMG